MAEMVGNEGRTLERCPLQFQTQKGLASVGSSTILKNRRRHESSVKLLFGYRSLCVHTTRSPLYMNGHVGPDCYDVLKLQRPGSDGPAISQNEIKSAYRRALLLNHPDKHQGSDAIQAGKQRYTIDEVTRAYDILIDPSRRLQYDRQLQLKLREKDDHDPGNHHTGIEAVDLDDLEYDGHRKEWHRECRCGDSTGFRFTEEELQGNCDNGEVIAECPGCSLLMRVTFAVADDGWHK